MKLFSRKNQLQRLLERVTDSLDAATAVTSGLPRGLGSSLPRGLGSSKALNAVVPKDKALRAGLIAGGLAGLTAGSAGISSLRSRKEGARDDS